MQKVKTYFLNTALAAVVFAALAAARLVRNFAPAMILPQADIPGLVLISLAALLLDHYGNPGADRCYICIPVFSLVTFGLLPWAAGFVSPMDGVKLGILGCAVFTATTWLFTSAQDRLSTGPAAKAAPILVALGLYLASQCFLGMTL